MISLLAALVPIGAALYVAVDSLVEQSRLRRERYVRTRVQALALEFQTFLATQLGYGIVEALARRSAFEDRMLAAYGIRPTVVTIGDFNINQKMSGPEMSRVEQRGQWILVVSAVVGVILLAISGLTAPPE